MVNLISLPVIWQCNKASIGKVIYALYLAAWAIESTFLIPTSKLVVFSFKVSVKDSIGNNCLFSYCKKVFYVIT